MTYQEVALMVESIGLPFEYYQFDDKTGQQPPFIVFYYPDINDLYADDENYQRITELDIELYTDTKDFYLESAVESVLKEHHITYTKNEEYISAEEMYQIAYTMEVLING